MLSALVLATVLSNDSAYLPGSCSAAGATPAFAGSSTTDGSTRIPGWRTFWAAYIGIQGGSLVAVAQQYGAAHISNTPTLGALAGGYAFAYSYAWLYDRYINPEWWQSQGVPAPEHGWQLVAGPFSRTVAFKRVDSSPATLAGFSGATGQTCTPARQIGYTLRLQIENGPVVETVVRKTRPVGAELDVYYDRDAGTVSFFGN